MFVSSVYLAGSSPVGEVEVYPMGTDLISPQREFEISSFTTFHDKRCSPLGALQSVGSCCLCFKMECKDETAKLISIYTTCLREKQTAVIQEEHDDIHLVAMKSRENPSSGATTRACFWGFKVSRSLFSTCLAMLKQRCLGIVLCLENTLVVVNTKGTFKDQINSLKHKISCENDPFRLSGMKAQIERYELDLLMLEQYAEDDHVIENGNTYQVQLETVSKLQQHLSKTRPVIRLMESGIILTRINPSRRDTSVLVRIRPGWEEMRNYLTPSRDQRPFDIYVCNMADRDLTMEIWRLLDPHFELITSSQLHHRVVCLKANSRKSLEDVFHYRQCHPKMSLVIDNRLDVWDENDQPRVHVIPTFSPYSAYQEEENDTPLLDVRNVASNVNQGFFRNFDDVFLPQIDEVLYEDEFTGLPSGPDVGNHLTSKECNALIFLEDPLTFYGMADGEVDKKGTALQWSSGPYRIIMNEGLHDSYYWLTSGPVFGSLSLSNLLLNSFQGAHMSLVEDNNRSVDTRLEQNCGDGSNLELEPVRAGSSGKGLPYAPEDWPKKGDVWTWKVGYRVARSGHFMDRYLYPPEQYTKGRLVLSSRLSVEEFVKKEFPGVNVNSFFASFSWKIPCKRKGLRKEKKTVTALSTMNPIAEPEPETEPEPRLESQKPEGFCMAQNKTCNLQKKQLEQALTKSGREPLPCNICCSEPGFCRECCCILCSKAVDLNHNSHTFIRCMATVDGSYICGHGAHINCALWCFLAGTVGGSIELDAEYYCRRCDNKMDLVPHVAEYCRVCRSVGSREKVISVLDLGLCTLSGSGRAVARKLHRYIDHILRMIKKGAPLDDMFKEDWRSFMDLSGPTPAETLQKESSLDSNLQHVLTYKRKRYDDDNMATKPSKKQKNLDNDSIPDSPSLGFDSPLEAEREVKRVLLELKKSQEYNVVEEKILSQKDHLFVLHQALKTDKADLSDPIVRQFTDSDTYSALVSSVNARADEVKKEETKLRNMLNNVQKFVQSHKLLMEQFGVAASSVVPDQKTHDS